MEKKYLDFTAEIKATNTSDDGKIGYFEGYGSVFGNKDSHGDVVEPGAFHESLKSGGFGKPAMLWQHDMYNPIGVYSEVQEDAKGLVVKGEINLEVQQGREAYALMKQGAIKGLSIGFRTEDDEYDRQNNVRHIKKVTLYEVSLVTFPSNRKANVTAWKGELPGTEREFEKFLRASGYSKQQSKAIASDGFKAASLGRDDQDDKPTDQRDADQDGMKQAQTSLEKLSQALKGGF